MGLMIVLVAVGLLWFGICALGVYMAVEDRSLIIGLASVVLLAIGAGFAVIFWDDAHATTIVLDESDWTCTDTRSFMQPVMVGKVLVSQRRTMCIEYRRG